MIPMLELRLKGSQWLLILWFVWGETAILGPLCGGDASPLLGCFRAFFCYCELGMLINGLNVIEFRINWIRKTRDGLQQEIYTLSYLLILYMFWGEK